MLKNKGAEVLVRYNGIERLVKVDGLLDVRDFDISIGQNSSIKDLIPKVEKQILRKHPGQFEVTDHTDNPQIEQQFKQEIDSLKEKNAQLEKALEAEKKVGAINTKKISEFADEINGFGEKEASYKKQITALKNEIKDLKEEHDAHVARLTGGKK